MAAAVRLREDFDGPSLRGLAKRARDAAQLRRLLVLAEIYDGGSRGEAARIGGVGLQTVRDWVLRFNAAGPAGLLDRKAPGKAPKLNAAQRQAPVQAVESGPIPAIHGVVRRRLVDLVQWVWDAFRIRISVQTLSRELRALGYRKLSARPRHYAQDGEAMAPRPCARTAPAAMGHQVRGQARPSARTGPSLRPSPACRRYPAAGRRRQPGRLARERSAKRSASRTSTAWRTVTAAREPAFGCFTNPREPG
ncbi:MAG: helix-turn-helix domain-containing protein [Kiloniellaceae bacterium]